MTSRSDWENKLVSHNLDLSQNLSILQTSTQRNLAETICLSIRSLVRRVPLIQKEVGEITEKVRVKDSNSGLVLNLLFDDLMFLHVNQLS